MSQIYEALQKVKTEQEGSKSGVVHKPRMRRGTDSAAAAISMRGRESALLSKARRVELDTETLQKNRVIASADTAGTSTAYKMLRTRVLQRMRANTWNRLAISSARPSAGKTLTAINTAITLSFEPNQTVVLADLDLRRPSMAGYLGIEGEFGLSDYLRGDAPLEKIIIKPDIERLLILPNFRANQHSAELLSSQRMVDLVETLTDPANSTIVIFDLPPLLDADDVLAFSPLFDALLMVVSQSETRRLDLHKSFELLHDINVLGVVLNKSRGKDEAPGYY
jgi:capsular exopolysaccharide synthesis family protein